MIRDHWLDLLGVAVLIIIVVFAISALFGIDSEADCIAHVGQQNYEYRKGFGCYRVVEGTAYFVEISSEKRLIEAGWQPPGE